MGLLASAFLFSYMLAAPLFGLLAERLAAVETDRRGGRRVEPGQRGQRPGHGFHCSVGDAVLRRHRRRGLRADRPRGLSDYFPVAGPRADHGLVLHGHPGGRRAGLCPGRLLRRARHGRRELALGVLRWCVPPGLLLALWSLLMREPARGAAEGVAAPAAAPACETTAPAGRTPSYVLDTLGMTAMTFAIGALAFWMPALSRSRTTCRRCLGVEPRTFFGIAHGGGRPDRDHGRRTGRRLAPPPLCRLVLSGVGRGHVASASPAPCCSSASRFPRPGCSSSWPCSSCSSTRARPTRSWPT